MTTMAAHALRNDFAAIPTGAIVVGLDETTVGQAALAWACDEADRTDRPLHLLQALDASTGEGAIGIYALAGDQDMDEYVQAARSYQTRVFAGVGRTYPDLRVSSCISTGTAYDVLVQASRRAHMIVLGDHSRTGLDRFLLGSTTVRVIPRAQCVVVVVKDMEKPHSARAGIVVGNDGSACSAAAIAFAFAEAEVRSCGLEVVHALESGSRSGDDTLAASSLARWREHHPSVHVSTTTTRQHPGRALTERAKEAELLVVGTHGRGEFASFVLGSVSHDVLRQAACPVAVVPAHANDDS